MQLNSNFVQTDSCRVCLGPRSGAIYHSITERTTVENLNVAFSAVYEGHTVFDADESFRSFLVCKAISVGNVPLIQELLKNASPALLEGDLHNSYVWKLLGAKNQNPFTQCRVAKILNACNADLDRCCLATTIETSFCMNGKVHMVYFLMKTKNNFAIDDNVFTRSSEVQQTLDLAKKIDDFAIFILCFKEAHPGLWASGGKDTLQNICECFCKLFFWQNPVCEGLEARLNAQSRESLDLF